MQPEKQYLYRYESQYESEYDKAAIVLKKYLVIDETDASYLIEYSKYWQVYSTKRVFKKRMNSFAFADIEKAKDHYERRTNKHIQLLEWRIRMVTKCLDVFKETIKG